MWLVTGNRPLIDSHRYKYNFDVTSQLFLYKYAIHNYTSVAYVRYMISIISTASKVKIAEEYLLMSLWTKFANLWYIEQDSESESLCRTCRFCSTWMDDLPSNNLFLARSINNISANGSPLSKCIDISSISMSVCSKSWMNDCDAVLCLFNIIIK